VSAFVGIAEKMSILILPWPPKALSPNARTHWRKKSPITKAYKHACWALTLESGMQVPAELKSASQRLHLWLEFYPPDRRHRDDDNMVASFKAGRDGVALALGIDDKRFICHPLVSDKIGGYVKVRLSASVQAMEVAA
jgi:crossover junction endodeoxyribonuclease RusA